MKRKIVMAIFLVLLFCIVCFMRPPSQGTVPNVNLGGEGEQYDLQMRADNRLSQKWFACSSVADCDLAHVPCSTSFAVRKAYLHDLEHVICGKDECRANHCTASVPDVSMASCKNNVCTTVFHWPRFDDSE